MLNIKIATGRNINPVTDYTLNLLPPARQVKGRWVQCLLRQMVAEVLFIIAETPQGDVQ